MRPEILDRLQEARDKEYPLPLRFGDDEPGTIAFSDLLNTELLSDVIREVAAHKGTDNLIASASLFQKRLSFQLLSVVCTPITCGFGFLLDPKTTRIKLENGLPVAIVLPEATEPLLLNGTDNCSHLYHSLFDLHMAPLIYRISEIFRLAPSVQWENVSLYCGYLSRLFREHPLWSEPQYPYLVPHTERVIVQTEKGPVEAGLRKTCCLWYQLPGNEDSPCAGCPRRCHTKKKEDLH
jgi:ferric iron reductase protein FhuF